MLSWHFIPRNHDNFIDPTKHDNKVMVTRGNLGGYGVQDCCCFHDIVPLQIMTFTVKKTLTNCDIFKCNDKKGYKLYILLVLAPT